MKFAKRYDKKAREVFEKYQSFDENLRECFHSELRDGNYTKKKIKQLVGIATRFRKDRLVEKENIISHIKSKTENGKVAVVWSGVDADCVSWGNRVDIVSSSYLQIEKMLNDVYEGSEGSIDFYYEKPSIAEKLTETSRDLAMEAFEEGHPHVVYR
tara:strand:+ start:1271 stop:1738 length:468 start_codon:yes stop_codon:yes gene_type:complete